MASSSHKAKLRRWLSEQYVPTILCSSTSKVEEICMKNCLTFTQLLTPFGSLQDESIPIRTVSKSYSLKDFSFKFSSIDECVAIPKAQANQFLEELVPTGTDREEIYLTLRKNLFDSLQHDGVQMLNHPLGHLIAVSTEDSSSPLDLFKELLDEGRLPQLFKDGVYDPTIQKYFVLVHDKASSSPALNPVETLNSIKKIFGDRCYLLEINSLSEGEANYAQPDIWSPFFSRMTQIGYFNNQKLYQSGNKLPRGALLSQDDLKRLQVFVQTLAYDGILRDTEERMTRLNQQVSALRKGLRNTFRLMWRKSKDIGRDQNSKSLDLSRPMYAYESIESQIRTLADLAFVLQDYEMALGLYRIVRDDFGADKAYLHRAAAYEMMALCTFLTEGSKKQSQEYMQKCFTDLLLIQSEEAKRYLTSACVLFSDLLKCYGKPENFQRAAELYVRGSVNEIAVVAAILLEQSANCTLISGLSAYDISRLNSLYFGENALTRKFIQASRNGRRYCFRLVTAGALFEESGRFADAFRCYRTVQAYYESGRWHKIKSHLNFSIATLMLNLDPKAYGNELLLRWSEILCKGNLPEAKQQVILQNFLHHLSQIQKDNESPEWHFDIPEILNSEIRLQSNASILPEDSTDEEFTLSKDWTILEDLTCKYNNELFFKTNKVQIHEKLRNAYIGEPIFVHFSLLNSLRVPLEITELSIFLRYHGDDSSFSVASSYTEGLVLDPSEERDIWVRFIPERKGLLQLLGIKYLFFGIAPFFRHMHFKETFHNQVVVMDAGAWLGVEVKGFPEIAFTGENIYMELEVINNGVEKCRGCIGLSTNIDGLLVDSSSSECLDDERSMLSYGTPLKPIDEAGHLFQLSICDLQPGLPVSIPIVARLSQDIQSKDFHFHALFSYCFHKNEVRLLRYRQSCSVQQGPACVGKVYPADRSREKIVSLSMSHDCVESFAIENIVCVTRGYNVVDQLPRKAVLSPKTTSTFAVTLSMVEYKNKISCPPAIDPDAKQKGFLAHFLEHERTTQSKHIPESNGVFLEESIDIAVTWSVDNRIGQAHMFNIPISSSFPLTVSIHLDSSRYHDFRKAAVCFIPVSIVFEKQERDVDCCHVELIPSETNEYYWIGKTKHRIESLSRHESFKLEVKAVVLKASKFSIGSSVKISANGVFISPDINFEVLEAESYKTHMLRELNHYTKERKFSSEQTSFDSSSPHGNSLEELSEDSELNVSDLDDLAESSSLSQDDGYLAELDKELN